MKVLIIIPAYNEEANIEKVMNNLITNYPMYDYIIVNDCSTDNTANICKTNNYKFLNLPVNLGIGGGVQAGYKYAILNNYDIAIQMDGDGQHDPQYIIDMIKPIEDDIADIVIGSRFITGEGFQSSKMRRIGINFLSMLIRICCGVKIKDVTSGFRAVNRKIIELYAKEYSQDYPEPEAIIAGAINGGRILEKAVVMYERSGGSSSINMVKSIYYMIKVSIAVIIYRITYQKNKKV